MSRNCTTPFSHAGTGVEVDQNVPGKLSPCVRVLRVLPLRFRLYNNYIVLLVNWFHLKSGCARFFNGIYPVAPSSYIINVRRNEKDIYI